MMKNVLMLFLLAPIFLSAQDKEPNPFQSEFEADSLRRNSRITITADAKNLFDRDSLDLNLLYISDNQGTPTATGSAIKTFTTDVFRGNKVTWLGELDDTSERLGYSIEILQIEILGENCLFERPKQPGKSGKVKATLRGGDVDLSKCTNHYAIWLLLYNPEDETAVFRLDPILKGNN